ncbi:fructosamine kinase family protein [Haliea sp. E17]|uniref:fructosamine kinase family protein n=1 Tax=Haliea sp. E17 TaxID=3401576 RepID=UPI003AAB6BB9
MVDRQDWQALASAVSAATGRRFRAEDARAVGGGCISSAYRVEGDGACYFVKTGPLARRGMFEAELEGLEAIRASRTLAVPRPLMAGASGDTAWLVLEFLVLGGSAGTAGAQLGEGLAALHAQAGESFGWARDNFIGATPQPNQASDNWVAFLGEQRLGFQLDLAARNAAPARLETQGRLLIEALPAFFTDYQPHPALLHGDLWGGNWGVLASGEPVVFDPAVYRGDREADIAMTELFGGFGADFHIAYRHHLPLDAGYSTRRDLYNLYHLLNHFNLFGGGYARQALAVTERLLAELG